MARVKRYKLDESPLYITLFFNSGYKLRFYFSTITGQARFKNQIDDYAEQVCGVLSRRYRGIALDGVLAAAFDLYSKIERAEQRIIQVHGDGTEQVLSVSYDTYIDMRCRYKGPVREGV